MNITASHNTAPPDIEEQESTSAEEESAQRSEIHRDNESSK